jgi:hypothetical protein
MGSGRPVRLLTLTALLCAQDLTTAPLPQVLPRPYDQRQGERYAIGADVSRYEALYGSPEFRGIDDEHARPWPRVHNIRTVAVLAAIPGRGGDQAGPAYTGRTIEYSNKYTSSMLCGERYCIGVAPVEEMVEVFLEQGRSWLHRKVEVIGALDQVSDPRDSSCPCYAFRVWSVQLFAEREDRRSRQETTLETLVRGPEAAAGRSITVRGRFRGANLFEDLPPETRRDPADWVLKDGPFSIWVTGRAPKGDGFSLDPRSRSDCDWKLEVTGKVETASRYLYLRAKRVALLHREKDEAAEP